MISGFAKNSFIMFKNIIKDQLLSKKCWLSIFSLSLLEIARKRNPGPEAHLWSQEQVSEDWIWSRPPTPTPPPILGRIVWGLEAELTESGTETSVVKKDEQVGIMKAQEVGVGFEEQ